MGLQKVTNPPKTFGLDLNLSKPLNGVVYPVLAVFVVLTVLLFTAFAALRAGVPMVSGLVSQIPGMGNVANAAGSAANQVGSGGADGGVPQVTVHN